MTDKLNVLTICGSLRKGSYNALIARALPALAPQGMTFTQAPPFGIMPLYDFDLQAEKGFPASVTAFADAIRAADGVIILTPEYNYSIPGALKNAIDWVSRLPDQPFAGKPFAIQSAATGLLGGARAQYHLRPILVGLDALVLNKPEVIVNFVKNKIDETKGELTDEATRDMIKQQLASFGKFIATVGGKR
ncbi:MAG TPA: NAD(P)H-dependent oxidoreductase [Xanthobacteraceae bacterium]|jgi:chromate reductase|nr:NAD(P)H-dependent oxidoreductase [Xanthobacteraceae bacterium]